MATAKQRWEKLNGERESVLQRARDCADLTIPALMPPLGANENTRLPTPYQSLGARGVNNLASKLTLTLLPAGSPFYRFQIGADAAEQMETDAKTQIEEGLRKIENRVGKGVENSNLRPVINITAKLLIVTGNACLHLPDEGDSRVFNVSQYVVVRDAMGTVTEGVIKESVSPLTLPAEVRAICQIDMPDGDSAKKDEDVDVFTHVRLTPEGKIEYHQEINDIMVPGSEGRSKAKDSPYIFLRWNALENENYGRGHCEEYLGDLRSLEDLTKSIVIFSAAAAKVIFLKNPSAVTKVEDLRDAESGDFVTGRREDIDVLQLEKFADFQVTKATLDDLTLRLSHGFLLTSGTIRHAERVTAEEVRLQAQELEDVLGGVYSVLSQELQQPLVNRLIARAKKKKDFPTLPEGAIDPVIVTGFDALGRGHELNRYRQYFSDGVALMGPEFMANFSAARVAQLLATQHNVDIADLKKTEQEVAQEQQQNMAQTVMEKGTAPAVAAAGKAMTE